MSVILSLWWNAFWFRQENFNKNYIRICMIFLCTFFIYLTQIIKNSFSLFSNFTPLIFSQNYPFLYPFSSFICLLVCIFSLDWEFSAFSLSFNAFKIQNFKSQFFPSKTPLQRNLNIFFLFDGLELHKWLKVLRNILNFFPKYLESKDIELSREKQRLMYRFAHYSLQYEIKRVKVERKTKF